MKITVEMLDALIEPMLRAARIPGAAVAVVADGKMVFASGYGVRDLQTRDPVTAATVYPIASTTKAINATVLGMLVDEGKLAWDDPVQRHLPGFRLGDDCISGRVTLRDLVTMRTGLPRHDWVWVGNPLSRSVLVERMRHLELSAGFRERFQYNNLTVTAAGHIAEIVAGESWEDLVRRRVFEPLGMSVSMFAPPTVGDFIYSYHETFDRALQPYQRLAAEVTAPSGGAIHSTVEDMARWMIFNLEGGRVGGRALIDSQTLLEINSPQILVSGAEAPELTSNPSYAMGWFHAKYSGHACRFHGGYLHDVNSEVTLFPEDGIGIVSFVNFGFPNFARLINQHVFDLLMGLRPAHALEDKLARYETKIAETSRRNAAACRVDGTVPSHSLDDYVGGYDHSGYGRVRIDRDGEELVLRRGQLIFPLEHWHYDAWVAKDAAMFPIYVSHVFDRDHRVLFETNADGDIAAVSLQLEPAVAPIRFVKRPAGSANE